MSSQLFREVPVLVYSELTASLADMVQVAGFGMVDRTQLTWGTGCILLYLPSLSHIPRYTATFLSASVSRRRRTYVHFCLGLAL